MPELPLGLDEPLEELPEEPLLEPAEPVEPLEPVEPDPLWSELEPLPLWSELEPLPLEPVEPLEPEEPEPDDEPEPIEPDEPLWLEPEDEPVAPFESTSICVTCSESPEPEKLARISSPGLTSLSDACCPSFVTCVLSLTLSASVISFFVRSTFWTLPVTSFWPLEELDADAPGDVEEPVLPELEPMLPLDDEPEPVLPLADEPELPVP